MPSLPAARSRSQRILDTKRRLSDEVDGWVASTDPGSGEAYLLPLSYFWTNESVLIATSAGSTMARSLRMSGKADFSLGATRDVVLIRANVTALTADELDSGEADAFAMHTGFDPREEGEPYLYFRLTPIRIQAWREVNELQGRTLFRDAGWLDAG